MNFNRKNMIIGNILFIILCSVLYIFFMKPFDIHDEISFINRINCSFSFYEYHFYTLILLPVYLIYFEFIRYIPIQKILRLKNKKVVAWNYIKQNFFAHFVL